LGILFIAVLVEHRLVADGRTDGQDKRTDTRQQYIPTQHNVVRQQWVIYEIWCPYRYRLRRHERQRKNLIYSVENGVVWGYIWVTHGHRK